MYSEQTSFEKDSDCFYTKDVGFAAYCVLQKKEFQRKELGKYFFKGSSEDFKKIKVNYVNTDFKNFNYSLVLLLGASNKNTTKIDKTQSVLHTKDVGFAAYCLLKKKKYLGKVSNQYYFEDPLLEYDLFEMEYINTPFKDFNHTLVFLLHS